MEEVRRDGEQVEVRLSLDELRLIGATLNEALNGGYAIPADIWEELVGASRTEVRAALDGLLTLLDR